MIDDASPARVADAMITAPKTLDPASGLDELRSVFGDDHVHLALVVGADGRLMTTVERSDLATPAVGRTSVAEVGTLVGRTVGPSDPLDAVAARLVADRRRRLAVVDDDGRLLGLLCLKRDRTGFCTDEGVRERALEAAQARREPPRPRRSVPVQVTTVRADGFLRRPDELVTEEPLEIRVAGPGQESRPVGVTMRTPGNDFELAVGFLLSEGILPGQQAVRGVGYCTRVDPDLVDQRYNVVTVLADRAIDLEGHRRLFAISSACGVCGRTALDRIEQQSIPVESAGPWPLDLLVSLPDALRSRQALFSRTGGLHGAGLFDRSGTGLAVREDIGRHNAVDKLVGWAALDRRLPLRDVALVVSGRLGFEIVQKAAMAGISHLVAVSAPSSLAIELAQRTGITVVGFVRAGRANIYCGDDGLELARRR